MNERWDVVKRQLDEMDEELGDLEKRLGNERVELPEKKVSENEEVETEVKVRRSKRNVGKKIDYYREKNPSGPEVLLD